MDEDTKRIVCRMIAGIVASDEDFDDTERHFLDKVMQQFGIPESEWDAIFPLLEHDEAVEAMHQLAAPHQHQAFDLLVEAALADGTVAPEERAYLNVVGTAIGMSVEDVAARLP